MPFDIGTRHDGDVPRPQPAISVGLEWHLIQGLPGCLAGYVLDTKPAGYYGGDAARER